MLSLPWTDSANEANADSLFFPGDLWGEAIDFATVVYHISKRGSIDPGSDGQSGAFAHQMERAQR